MIRRTLTVFVLMAMVSLLLPAIAGAASDTTAIPETTAERVEGFSVQARPGPDLAAASAGPSEALRSVATRTRPFTMVGFELPDAEPIRFRTSVDGETWTDWEEAEPMGPDDEGPDADHPDAAAQGGAWRFMTQTPTWTGPAEWLQVEGADPARVAAHLIDTDGLARSFLQRARDALRGALGSTAAAPADAMPRVITRAQWGADESWRKGSPSYASDVRYAIVHHTANNNTYSASQAASVVRGIYHYHTRSLGWSDIGYNFLVDRYGRIYEGRAGGMDRAVIGAHAQGFNTGSVGVSIIGTFSSVRPPSVAVSSLTDVLAFKAAVHGYDPEATITVRSGGSNKWPRGTSVRMGTISGHRDVGNTDCPGNSFYALLPQIRKDAAAGVGDWEAYAARACQPSGDAATGPVFRAWGDNRIQTAIVASKWYWRDGEGRDVVVASARNWPDALSAAALAAEYDAPLLLTEPGGLPADVRDELGRLGARRVFLLGGVEAVGVVAEAELRLAVTNVVRVHGANRYGTAAETAKRVGARSGEVVVALGDHADEGRAFTSALAGSALAATPQRLPTLLVHPGSVPVETELALQALDPKKVYLVADEGLVSDTVTEWLRGRYDVVTLEGTDRYGTSLAVVAEAKRRLPRTSSDIVFASAVNYPDALAGGAVGARLGAPLLLVHDCALDRVTRITSYLSASRDAYDGGVILGGPAAVGDRVRWQLNQALTR